MDKGNPRLGFCLCGGAATIRDTKAEDGRLHFSCHDLTPEGRAKHYGFVDRSEVAKLEGAEMETDAEEADNPWKGWEGIIKMD